MAFESVDVLQQTLASTVFAYATDQKKAAGRAMGTLVEIVTYYALLSKELRNNVVIERSIHEFANPTILHNVEFSLHPVITHTELEISPVSLPLTAKKIARHMSWPDLTLVKASQLLDKNGVKRNSTVLLENEAGPVIANANSFRQSSCQLTVCELSSSPFAIIECKRVGVEQGMSKGPQTIEKAKQGAYVARSVSALQRVRLRNGDVHGVIELSDGRLRSGPYTKLLQEIMDSRFHLEHPGFILTVGVVSNHGNWFTSDDHNKELRVLAQSYDWLLFLTDEGVSQFIDNLLLNPKPELAAARNAFLASYSGRSGNNRFTKVRIFADADEALRSYFSTNTNAIEGWFNVITPKGKSFKDAHSDLTRLAAKI